jgi:hypothetical protein
MRSHPRAVEDFTNPFLVSFCLVLFLGLMVLWMNYGYGTALVGGFFSYIAITRVPRRN